MITSALIGVSLSMDAFAISLTNGLTVQGFRLRHALLMALYFGGFQFLMPLAGCLLGSTVSGLVDAAAPYISFGLLAFIGGKMIWEALRGGDEDDGGARMTHGRLLAMAVATSIDALAVGVSFAFSPPAIGLWWACGIIGVVTFVICTAGGMLGRYIPGASGKKAEIAGGVILVGIGVKLLLEGIL